MDNPNNTVTLTERELGLKIRRGMTQGLVMGALIATSIMVGVVALAFWLA